MRRWLFLLGALAAAVIAVTGVIAFAGNESRPLVGGEPAPPPSPTIPPRPAFGFTPEPILPGSVLAQRPEFSSQPPVEVTVKGKTIVLPAPAHLRVSSGGVSPCGIAAGLQPVEGAALGFGKSVVVFTLDGLLLESHVDPLDEHTLAPLLGELTPGQLPNPQCATVNGQLVLVPAGATVAGPVIGEPGPLTPPDWPTSFQVLYYGKSWVSFTHDGYILESHIAQEDEQALAPFLSRLTSR